MKTFCELLRDGSKGLVATWLTISIAGCSAIPSYPAVPAAVAANSREDSALVRKADALAERLPDVAPEQASIAGESKKVEKPLDLAEMFFLTGLVAFVLAMSPIILLDQVFTSDEHRKRRGCRYC